MAKRIMHSISKLSNNRIKEITKLHQKKYRDELGLFIAEGEKILEELVNANAEIIEIIALKDKKLNCSIKNIKYVDENIMKKIATTSSVCEVLTIAKKRELSVLDITKKNKLVLLDSISDPGNLGTIIRSACAFGIEGIILYGDCVDLYSPKVIRSCTGNFFKIPIIQIHKLEELNKNLKSHTKIATSLSKENNIEIKACKDFEKFIIMFGSEAKGLCKELTNITEKNIKIDMKNNVESLNLAISASIIFYELSKK